MIPLLRPQECPLQAIKVDMVLLLIKVMELLHPEDSQDMEPHLQRMVAMELHLNVLALLLKGTLEHLHRLGDMIPMLLPRECPLQDRHLEPPLRMEPHPHSRMPATHLVPLLLLHHLIPTHLELHQLHPLQQIPATLLVHHRTQDTEHPAPHLRLPQEAILMELLQQQPLPTNTLIPGVHLLVLHPRVLHPRQTPTWELWPWSPLSSNRIPMLPMALHHLNSSLPRRQ